MGGHKSSAQGQLIVLQAFLKEEERSQIDNLTHHLHELEKEEQIKPLKSAKGRKS